MSEVKALLATGFVGVVTPWLVHWLSGVREPIPGLEMGYWIAFLVAFLSSAIAIVGAIWLLAKPRERRDESRLILVLGLGMAGVASSLLVGAIGMM